MPEERLSDPPRPHPHPGLFLALEGPDGGGKTTQAARLAAWLRGTGSTWFRAATRAARRLATGSARSFWIATPSTSRSGPKC